MFVWLMYRPSLTTCFPLNAGKWLRTEAISNSDIVNKDKHELEDVMSGVKW